MNFLSHHAVALALRPDAPPDFFLGNVLPDLISNSGVGKLREKHVAGRNSGSALVEGIRLHLAADRHFHGLPEFLQACESAKAVLRGIPFAIPPVRTFFLVHAAVEVALDGLLIRKSTVIADDFYTRLTAADSNSAAAAVCEWIGVPERQGDLAETLHGFIRRRYLYHYADIEGQAEALHGIYRRAGLPGFPGDDLARLAEFFAALAPILSPIQEALLSPPDEGRRMVQ